MRSGTSTLRPAESVIARASAPTAAMSANAIARATRATKPVIDQCSSGRSPCTLSHWCEAGCATIAAGAHPARGPLAAHGGIGEEQLLAVDLVRSDRILPFRRDHPVD